MKKLYIVIVLIGLAITGEAQDNTVVNQFMQKAMNAYRNTAYLDFHVLYRYANKNRPGNFIDSLAGDIAMDKNRVRMVIDGIETITTNNYTIRVMKEDKLIYLAKTNPQMMIDPIAMLDSALVHTSGVQSTVSRNGKSATLHLSFPPGQLYKNITMTMDESTGYFQKVSYELYTAGLVERDQIDQPGKPAPYQEEGVVEILFTKYRKGAFSDALFNEAQYVTRQGPGRFEPAEQYKDYQVFLASPNL